MITVKQASVVRPPRCNLLELKRSTFKSNKVKLSSTNCCSRLRQPPLLQLSSMGEDIVKSVQDKKLYRWSTLPNKMQLLLISDPEANAAEDENMDGAENGDEEEASSSEGEEEHDGSMSEDEEDDEVSLADEEEEISAKKPEKHKKAAVAMAVGTGSFSDPDELPGLSHYLEHMLFMGSEKFPDENEYDNFLTQHGGSSNAFTELEMTNYHFSVKPSALRGAMERFAQFFLSPLVKADALEREVLAVDNEFTGVLQSDSCRLMQLRCHTAVPGHPFRKFSWGNRRSLQQEPAAKGLDVREHLLQYYRGTYSAEHMALVVLGREPLDTLQQWAAELFGGVPATGVPRPTFAAVGQPFKGSMLYVMPAVKEGHTLNASFQLPCLHPHYRAKPEEYLSHLIGNECQGSLLSALKARGWATELCAGVGEGGYDRSSALYVFDVSITLTEAGLNAGPGLGLAAIGLLFDYVRMLRRAGPQRWVYEEMAAVGRMKFRFAEEDDACNYASRLAGDLLLYAPQDVLVAPWLYEEWRPEVVTQLLEAMTPETVRVDLQTSGAFEAAQQRCGAAAGGEAGREPWFDLPYCAMPLPGELVKAWGAEGPEVQELHLPPQNDFIPTNFSLVCDAAAPLDADASITPPDSATPHTAGTAKAEANGVSNGTTKGNSEGPAAPAVENGGPKIGQAATNGVNGNVAGNKRGREHGGNGDDGTGPRKQASGEWRAPEEVDAEASVAALPNPWLSAVDLEAVVAAPPQLIRDSEGLRVWHKLDRSFRVPRAAAYFCLAVAGGYASPRAAAAQHLVTKLLEDALCEAAYFAELAGLSYEVVPQGRSGLDVKVEGFSHKLPQLVALVFRTLGQLQVDPSAFERVRGDLVRKYSNANMNPGRHATYQRIYALNERLWHSDAVLAQLRELTVQDVQEFLPQLRSRAHLEALICGNIAAPAAARLAESALDLLGTATPLLAAERPSDCCVLLPPGADWLNRLPAKNPKEEMSATECYYQCERDSVQARAIIDMVEQIAQEPAYNQLRTREQLGYSVHLGTRLTYGMLGLCLVITSGSHPPSHLDARIEAFLQGFHATLSSLSAAEFERHRAALVAAKLQQDHSLLDEADRMWEEVGRRRYDFVARDAEAAALRALKQADVAAWYARHLLPGSPHRRKLAIHIVSHGREADLAAPVPPGVKLVEDLDAAKAGLKTYCAAREQHN